MPDICCTGSFLFEDGEEVNLALRLNERWLASQWTDTVVHVQKHERHSMPLEPVTESPLLTN